MSAKTVSMGIPQQIEAMFHLGTDVIARNTVLGVNSPLNNSAVDMVAFTATHQLASGKRSAGLNSHPFGEAAIQDLNEQNICLNMLNGVEKNNNMIIYDFNFIPLLPID